MKLRATVPVFTVSDVAATMRWYEETLGFVCRAVPEETPHHFGIMRRDDVEIFLQWRAGYEKPERYHEREGGVWDVYVHMDDVRAQYQQLIANPSVTILAPLCHQEYGQTEFVLRDPNGYVLVFAESD